MIRLVLIRCLRPLVSRGRTWLSDLQKLEKHRSTSHFLFVSKHSCVNRRVIRYISCIGAGNGEIDMNLNVATERLPRNQANVWTRCQDLVTKGDVGHFVVILLDYLRSSGGHGRANLADDLSKCVQHVRRSCCSAIFWMCLFSTQERLVKCTFSSQGEPGPDALLPLSLSRAHPQGER